MVAITAQYAIGAFVAALVVGIEMLITGILTSTVFWVAASAYGIYTGIERINAAKNNPHLTRNQTAYEYGFGTTEIILSLLPFWGKFKRKSNSKQVKNSGSDDLVMPTHNTSSTINKTTDFEFITAENKNFELYRRKVNIGKYSELSVTMDLQNVKYLADKGGIGLKGIKIRIIRDPDLIGKGIYGYTHPNGKMIDLYPDSFINEETLIRTLGHERMHVYQVKTFGAPTNSLLLKDFEIAAYQSEDFFHTYYLKYGKPGK